MSSSLKEQPHLIVYPLFLMLQALIFDFVLFGIHYGSNLGMPPLFYVQPAESRKNSSYNGTSPTASGAGVEQELWENIISDKGKALKIGVK